MDADYLAVKNYVFTFKADRYRVQLSNKERPELIPINLAYTPDQLIRSVPFLREKNQAGYNIYARPISYRFILIDDLQRDSLAELAEIKPCLLMETSPANYQAFLMLAQEPESRDLAKQICRKVCEQFGGDSGSAEPDHVGRLPGYYNRKEKHRTESGSNPMVILHRYEHRITTYLPQRGACAQESLPKVVALIGKDNDRSREDFNTVCKLIRQRKTDDYIQDALLEQSDKAQERGAQYIALTIRNARKALDIYL